MKISKRQKQLNRAAIIAAAVHIVSRKGLSAATMREIAKRAGLADATIYNYFSTKDAIIYGYYADKFEEVIGQLKAIPDFNTYTFQEQLQAFFETKLALYLSDRQFLDQTFKKTFFTLSQDHSRIRPIKNRFMTVIEEIFTCAAEAGEIPDPVFRELALQIFWEFFVGVVMYWLKDESDQFENTHVLIEKSMDLACASIRAGIGNKIFDMGVFLFKNHILSRMDLVKDRVDTLHTMKKNFMAARDDE